MASPSTTTETLPVVTATTAPAMGPPTLVSLPVEIKNCIAHHISSFEDTDPLIARQSLASARLICRGWSAPPLKYLYRHIYVPLPLGARCLCLARLLVIAQSSHLADQVRHVTVITTGHAKGGCQKFTETSYGAHVHDTRSSPAAQYRADRNFNARFWSQLEAAKPPDPCDCPGVTQAAGVLAQVAYDIQDEWSTVIHAFRYTISRFPHLDSLNIFTLSAFSRTYPTQLMSFPWAARWSEDNDARMGHLLNAVLIYRRLEHPLTNISINTTEFSYGCHQGNRLNNMYYFKRNMEVHARSLRRLCLRYRGVSNRRYGLDDPESIVRCCVRLLNTLFSTTAVELPNMQCLELSLLEEDDVEQEKASLARNPQRVVNNDARPVITVPKRRRVPPREHLVPLSTISRHTFPNLHTLHLHGFTCVQEGNAAEFPDFLEQCPKLKDLKLGLLRVADGVT
ncbi:uncharacterized protein AB675_7596 [Cyphellophora attinorum]|uniref:F-box domain-containing protein n=1 Tax=Cyphellophora attinorum TaxID=1664694 RepID=A0A0N0NMI7_9EURO|nr:uncharacterized protein AB675_7596 [Phialophora attinorum]KPI40249.1 hypothetical protein AB675_7596 [Phialophora attinorum]